MRIDFPASCLRDHLQGDMEEGTVTLLKKVSAIQKITSAIMEVEGGAVGSLPSYSHVPVAPPLGVVGVCLF
jgi:hypothetical protein